jgi:tRNA (adenine37-N6)-methyltransferase
VGEIKYNSIGVIHSPFTDVKGMPIQPIGAQGVRGTIELDADFGPGIKDLAGFSHIMLIYSFHRCKGYSLHVRPFLDDTDRGVFATRVPRRPNSIGLSVVRLVGIRGTTLDIEDVDILDGTPLLDIKPFIPAFDHRDVLSIGWFTERTQKATSVKSDDRFADTKDENAEPA